KSSPYAQSPSGLPLVQHALPMMLTMAERHGWDLPFIVRKMAHDPAICFQILDRGFIREGYYADLVLLDANAVVEVVKSDLLYKCGWSPLEGRKLKGKIKYTLVNGQVVFDGSRVLPQRNAKRLEFFRA
ncbi:MAG TPA: amidohydrolase family protein, partial [Saprospiraceae bacterium]|nr:amidohydrolase family protein [Saprospiraceae bacterium]